MEGITSVFNHAVITGLQLYGAAPWLTLLQRAERFDPKHPGTALHQARPLQPCQC